MVMVVLFMLMLVVAQADDSSKIPAASSSTPFLPQDKPDCYNQCVVLLCIAKRLLPTFFVICLNSCRTKCTQPPSQARDAIYYCTVACAESMSTKLGSGII